MTSEEAKELKSGDRVIWRTNLGTKIHAVVESVGRFGNFVGVSRQSHQIPGSWVRDRVASSALERSKPSEG